VTGSAIGTTTSDAIQASIDGLSVSVVTVDTDAPEADGTLEWTSTTIVLVELSADRTTGLGYTYAPAACADVIRTLLKPIVVGDDAMNIGGIHLSMQRAVRNAGRPGLVSCAISAVDIALWDLKARLLGLPLHQLLGGIHEQVPVYGSGGFTSYDDTRLHDQLSGWVVDQRIPRAKIKIGESRGTNARRDLHRIQVARASIGADAELYVDANGAYTAKQAIRLMAAGKNYDVTWLEEPVSSDNLTGLRQVRDAVTADVTAGEYGYHPPYFAHMLAAGAVDCLQIDVTRCGGITAWQRIAALADGYGLEVSGHCAPHAHAAVAAATPNLRHLEWFHDHVRIESILFHGTSDPAGGTITPNPARPGLGLDLRDLDDLPAAERGSVHVQA
jgi:L-alanine-DL-glutamate epimerase-like enolase superfamily enzyme